MNKLCWQCCMVTLGFLPGQMDHSGSGDSEPCPFKARDNFTGDVLFDGVGFYDSQRSLHLFQLLL